MRLVCISDTHSMHEAVFLPEGDVLVHAGDFSSRGRVAEAMAFVAWLEKQPHKHKVFIAGNHDFCMERDGGLGAALTASTGVVYLCDAGVELDGVKFYGSPWQPEFCDWAFNLPRNSPVMRDVWGRVPSDTDVLITHGPPHGMLDEVADFQRRSARVNVGCEVLRTELERVQPKVHVFGHIHEGYGTHVDGVTTYVNAATCTQYYRPTHAPIVIDL